MADRHAKLLTQVKSMNREVRCLLKEGSKEDLFEARVLEAFQVQGRFTDTLNPRSAATDDIVDLHKSASDVQNAEASVKLTMQTAVEKILKFMVDRGWESPNGKFLYEYVVQHT
jgi:hypothetical protein